MRYPVLIASHRGRFGRYLVTIYRMADELPDPLPEPVYANLLAAPQIRYGRLDLGYGAEILPSYCDLSVLDEAGHVIGIFREEDEMMEAEIVGPRIHWAGRVARGELQRPISRRTTRGRFTISLHDGLSALDGVVAPPAAAKSTLEVARRALQAAAMLPVIVRLDVRPEPSTEIDAGEIFYIDELAGPGARGDEPRGDFGNYRDQLEAVARQFGLRVYQDSRTATWYAVHRALVGTEYSGQTVMPSGDVSSDPVEARLVDITESDHGGAPDDRIHELDALSGVRIRQRGQANLIRNPNFALWTGLGTEGRPLHWSVFGGVGYIRTTIWQLNTPDYEGITTAIQLESDASVFQDVALVAPDLNVRLEFRAGISAVDNSGAEVGYIADVPIEVTLDPGGGADPFWLGADGEWKSSPEILEQTVTVHVGEEIYQWATLEVEAVEDFPVSGRLGIMLYGASGRRHRYTGLSFRMIDDEGEPITDWTTTYAGSTSGRLVDMEPPPDMRRLNAFGPLVSEWVSERYGDVYDDLISYLAADRLAQHRWRLDVLDTTVVDLLSPGDRVMYDERDFIANGLVIDTGTGQTRGVWCEVPPVPEEVEA